MVYPSTWDTTGALFLSFDARAASRYPIFCPSRDIYGHGGQGQARSFCTRGGRLNVEGTLERKSSVVNVLAGGRLGGQGTIERSVNAQGGGVISPGN